MEIKCEKNVELESENNVNAVREMSPMFAEIYRRLTALDKEKNENHKDIRSFSKKILYKNEFAQSQFAK